MQDLLRFQLYVSVELATQIKDLTRFTRLWDFWWKLLIIFYMRESCLLVTYKLKTNKRTNLLIKIFLSYYFPFYFYFLFHLSLFPFSFSSFFFFFYNRFGFIWFHLEFNFNINNYFLCCCCILFFPQNISFLRKNITNSKNITNLRFISIRIFKKPVSIQLT